MARLDLYIDCDSKESVVGTDNQDVKEIPFFVQGNTPLLRIRLRQNWSRSSGYESMPIDDLTLQVALWEASSGILSAQYVWTQYDGDYFEAALALNTQELDTFLGSSTSKAAIFQVDYLRSGLPTTVLLQQVIVKATGIDLDSLVPVATPTPLSAEAAASMFVKRHDDQPIYLIGADLSEIKLWNDNGTYKADNVT